VHRDLHEHVLGRRLGILDEDIELAVPLEHPGVEQLVLRRTAERIVRSGSRRPFCPTGVVIEKGFTSVTVKP
jgi:hypothetical protein